MTKQDEIAALRAELADILTRLDAIQNETDKVEKWEPKGGEWYVNALGEVCMMDSDEISRNYGTEYPTEAAALSALPYMRFHNRMLCLAAELNPSAKVGGRWCVTHGTSSMEYRSVELEHCGMPTGFFETRESADKACKIMNRDGWKIETT